MVLFCVFKVAFNHFNDVSESARVGLMSETAPMWETKDYFSDAAVVV